MSTVMNRLLEAAGNTTYTLPTLSVTADDGCLRINQFKDPKNPWLLGFVKPTKDEKELEVSTLKYVNKMGSTRTRKMNTSVSVYTLLKCLKLDLEDNRFLSRKVTEELLTFGDWVIETNRHSKVNYKLTQSDIDEYNYRNPDNDVLTYRDGDTLNSKTQSLITLINHIEETQGLRVLYRRLSGTDVDGLTGINKLTFIDYLFIGAIQIKDSLHNRKVIVNQVGGVVKIEFLGGEDIQSVEFKYVLDRINITVEYTSERKDESFTDHTTAGSAALARWESVYTKVRMVLLKLPPEVQSPVIITLDELLRTAGAIVPAFRL